MNHLDPSDGPPIVIVEAPDPTPPPIVINGYRADPPSDGNDNGQSIGPDTARGSLRHPHHARVFVRNEDEFGEIVDRYQSHNDRCWYYAIQMDTGGRLYGVTDLDLTDRPDDAEPMPPLLAALPPDGPDFGDPPPRPTPPPPPDIWDGQKVAYHFHKNLARFIATLRGLDTITRAQWAVAYSEYMAPLNTTGTPLTAAHVMRVWDKMISGDVSLPPRAA